MVEGEGWKKAESIKLGDKIGVPRKIDLPEREIQLSYKFALNNLKKNSQNCILYEDYLRLKNKTKNFNEFRDLEIEELYEIKTLIETSFKKLGEDLGISLSMAYKLFNKKTVLRVKCQAVRIF